MTGRSVDQLLADIASLPTHYAGPLYQRALEAIVRHVGSNPILHSVETGAGHSTLLLSHLSQDHKVFSIAGPDAEYLKMFQSSSLLNRSSVEFIEGPTQRTLPLFRFTDPIQLALIDGPHSYPFPDLEYYYIYPHLDRGALLIVDDIQIPTIQNLFAFLKEDEMFQLVEVVGTTAFFRRTHAPVFDPPADAWEEQRYNAANFPAYPGLLARWSRTKVPAPVRKVLKRLAPEGVRKRLAG